MFSPTGKTFIFSSPRVCHHCHHWKRLDPLQEAPCQRIPDHQLALSLNQVILLVRTQNRVVISHKRIYLTEIRPLMVGHEY